LVAAERSEAALGRKRLESSGFTPTNLVLRTQVVDRDNYIRDLKEARGHEGELSGLKKEGEELLTKVLDNKMWMTEFSLPELFSVNKRKLGEILLPLRLSEDHVGAIRNGQGPPPPLFRMVNYISLPDEEPIELSLRSHTGLYRRKAVDLEF